MTYDLTYVNKRVKSPSVFLRYHKIAPGKLPNYLAAEVTRKRSDDTSEVVLTDLLNHSSPYTPEPPSPPGGVKRPPAALLLSGEFGGRSAHARNMTHLDTGRSDVLFRRALSDLSRRPQPLDTTVNILYDNDDLRSYSGQSMSRSTHISSQGSNSVEHLLPQRGVNRTHSESSEIDRYGESCEHATSCFFPTAKDFQHKLHSRPQPLDNTGNIPSYCDQRSVSRQSLSSSTHISSQFSNSAVPPLPQRGVNRTHSKSSWIDRYEERSAGARNLIATEKNIPYKLNPRNQPLDNTGNIPFHADQDVDDPLERAKFDAEKFADKDLRSQSRQSLSSSTHVSSQGSSSAEPPLPQRGVNRTHKESSLIDQYGERFALARNVFHTENDVPYKLHPRPQPLDYNGYIPSYDAQDEGSKPHLDSSTEKSAVPPRQRTPSVSGVRNWQSCLQLDEDAALETAERLLREDCYPEQRVVNELCVKFGRKSCLVSTVCNHICKHIEQYSEDILYAWAAYRIKEKNKIHFVVVVKEGKRVETDKKTRYDIVERDVHDFSSEVKVISKDLSNLKLESSDTTCIKNAIDEHVEGLFKRHKYLSIVSASPVRSKGYQTDNVLKVTKEVCIVLHVHTKDSIPRDEEPFEITYGGMPVDVREGEFLPCMNNETPRIIYNRTDGDGNHLRNLRMGDRIENLQDNAFGTLGGFVDHPLYGLCGISCAHVLLNMSQLKKVKSSGGEIKWPNLQNICFARQGMSTIEIGKVVTAHYKKGKRKDGGCGLDVCLFQIEKRCSLSGKLTSLNTAGENGEKSEDVMRSNPDDSTKDSVENSVTGENGEKSEDVMRSNPDESTKDSVENSVTGENGEKSEDVMRSNPDDSTKVSVEESVTGGSGDISADVTRSYTRTSADVIIEDSDTGHFTEEYNSGKTLGCSRLSLRKTAIKYGAATGRTTGEFTCVEPIAYVRTLKDNGKKVTSYKVLQVQGINGDGAAVEFADHGDSGSLVFVKDESNDDELACVGMVIGINKGSGTCFVTPIETILYELQLSSFKQFKVKNIETRLDVIDSKLDKVLCLLENRA